jgi:hypothetical protein
VGRPVSKLRTAAVLALVCSAAAATPAAAAPLIAAAGDVACPPSHPAFFGGLGTRGKCRQASTARLLYGAGYDAVLPIGDLIEPYPSLRNFRGVWTDTWGRLKGRTYPVLGNHEYDIDGAVGYFRYFNGIGNRDGRVGTRGRGWYSYDLGRWHLIALNSNCGKVGCGPESRQLAWLRRNLRAHPRRCVLAYWHHPLFSSGAHDAEQPVRYFWRALRAAGADVVLNGHDHLYERFAPKTPDGEIDRGRGIVQFTVGTGGRSLFRFTARKRGSRRRVEQSFGILRLRLGGRGFRWRFIAADGRGTLDRGGRHCSPRPAPDEA